MSDAAVMTVTWLVTVGSTLLSLRQLVPPPVLVSLSATASAQWMIVFRRWLPTQPSKFNVGCRYLAPFAIIAVILPQSALLHGSSLTLLLASSTRLYLFNTMDDMITLGYLNEK
jgi:hypothetical protein